MSGFNEIIHQPVRLKIMAALCSLEDDSTIDFSYLKKLLEVSDGNLGSHIRKLEEKGFITVEKTFVGRKPKSFIQATEIGISVYREHVKHLRAIIS